MKATKSISHESRFNMHENEFVGRTVPDLLRSWQLSPDSIDGKREMIKMGGKRRQGRDKDSAFYLSERGYILR